MQLFNKNTLSTFFTSLERQIDLPIPAVTVLAYHAISHDHTIVDIEPAVFKRQLDMLKNRCLFITLDEVIAFIRGEKTFSRPAVALTFDDGYQDVFTTVAPILAKRNIPATVFALSDPRHANRKELENTKPLLSMQELHMLHKMGWTIGCHSRTHANFADPTLNLQDEITAAKKHMEQALGCAVSYFVYPKGIYSDLIVSAVVEAGFTAAFAFEAGFIATNSNLFTIPRVPVDWTHTDEQFSAFFTNWAIQYLQTKQIISKQFHRA